MKQFELHPASESSYRKEDAVNCFRRLPAAILSLVVTLACTFLVLAASSPTAYAAEAGETFAEGGLTYKVLNDSRQVELVGCDESASSVNVRTLISHSEGTVYVPYSVTSVSEDAFSNYGGTVVFEQNVSSFYENIFNSLPESATLVLNCANQLTENGTTIQLLSRASYVLEADGANQTISLPEGRSFSEIRVESAYGLTILNKSDAPISLQCESTTKEFFPVELAVGDQYSTNWLWPILDQFSYSVNGGEPVLVEGTDRQSEYSVELPAETPLDATIAIDISSFPGIAKGYVSENNLTTLTIIENSKTTLKELYAYHNKFALLDLSDMKLDICLLKEATATEPGQEPNFKGVLQEDGTVTVDLSDLAANIVSVDLGSEGRYDAETGILTFNSKDAANAGFSYIYDTKGAVLDESGSDYVPVYMDVAAHVELEGSLPGGGDSQGGSDGSGSQGGSGSASNDDNSIQQALVATGDKLVIPGLLVCAAAAGVVLFIARRKIS